MRDQLLRDLFNLMVSFFLFKARFSPRRNRDVSSKLNQVGGVFGAKFMSTQGTHEAFNNSTHPVDFHSDIYDSRITVSLSSVRINFFSLCSLLE